MWRYAGSDNIRSQKPLTTARTEGIRGGDQISRRVKGELPCLRGPNQEKR